MRSLIGKQAPKFNATAVINGHEIVQNFSLDRYKGKKYVVFFFYPMDFTFVCPTELHAFQEKLAEFEKRNVALVGCSVDSEYSHFSWLQMPKNEGGIQGVKYLISPNRFPKATEYWQEAMLPMKTVIGYATELRLPSVDYFSSTKKVSYVIASSTTSR